MPWYAFINFKWIAFVGVYVVFQRISTYALCTVQCIAPNTKTQQKVESKHTYAHVNSVASIETFIETSHLVEIVLKNSMIHN